MPIVKKEVQYVVVAYELICGYERATALADDMEKTLRDEKGFLDAKDDTRGFDRNSVILVTFATLQDAVRLDKVVREHLSRKVAFTYTPHLRTSYGSRGAESYVEASTTVQKV